MKKHIVLLFLISITECESNNLIRNQLEGRWMLEPSMLTGDTVIYWIEDNFDYPRIKSVAVRKLDSGYFVFTSYDSILQEVKPSFISVFVEYEFLNDSSGFVHYYIQDTSVHELNNLDMSDTNTFYIKTPPNQKSVLYVLLSDSTISEAEININKTMLKLTSKNGDSLIAERKKNPDIL